MFSSLEIKTIQPILTVRIHVEPRGDLGSKWSHTAGAGQVGESGVVVHCHEGHPIAPA